MLKKSAVFLCVVGLSLVAASAWAQTDAVVTASVKTRLAADDLVKASDITVATTDHVVTLRGTVPGKAAKERAVTIAKGTAGVTSVVDELKIAYGPVSTKGETTAEKAAAGVEKGADKGADAVGTAAHKSAGAVDKTKKAAGTAAKKTGEALETAAKKTGQAVETAAGATANAVGVSADKTKDATITAAVKTKLLGDGETPGLKINVDTDDGVVTLSGRVASRSQRDEAIRLARETKGVRRVVDKLTIGK